MAEPFESRRERSRAHKELRRLTVLFCDIVGSTELGAGLDIEDYCALIDRFQDLCRQEIDEAGGWVAQFQGDGVLAYFGYPALFEDPARRAVHAGLAIVDDLKSRSFQLPSHAERRLSVRVSAHTGPVVTSDSEPAVNLPEGMSINIAKKIQQFAPSNGVVITSETEELVRRYFDLKGPKSVAIEHVASDFPIFEVTSERPNVRLARIPFSANLPPIVARHGELRFLDDRWETAQRGEGQCILLLGEAGIGKSRLIQEFRHRNRIDDTAWFEIRCTPDTAESAFFPFREFLAAGLSGSNTTDLKSLRRRAVAHLQALELRTESNERTLVSLLGALPRSTDPEPVLPAVIRQRIKDFLTSYFLACSTGHALVLVFEDLHWADASTREIIQDLAPRCRSASIFIICALRPEGVSPFSGRADVTSLVLDPLPPRHVKQLADNLNGESEISDRQATRLFEITGGNPLFVEQYVASHRVRLGDDLETSKDVTPIRVPPSLQQLITYRLDKLDEAKGYAQCAAVLGQFIRPRTLQKILDVDATEFDRNITELVRCDILAYTGESVMPTLCFRHALIRDAAYETLLGSERRHIHERTAEQLVEEQSRGELIPHEVIGRHFALAQKPSESIAHWELAAADAAARFANNETLSHLQEALSQVQALPAGEGDTAEIAIREAMTVPLAAIRGWAASETVGNLDRLLELQASRADDIGVFGVYHGLCSMHGIRGEVSKALGYAEQMQTIADRTGDPALQVLSLRLSGVMHFLLADFPTSLGLFEQMASLYTGEVRERVLAHYPANPVAVGCAFSAWGHALTGNEKEALVLIAKARNVIASAKDEFTRAYVEGFSSSVWIALGRYDAAIASAKTCLSLSERNSFDYWISWAKITSGYSRLVADSRELGALDLMEEGLNEYRSTGSRLLLPYAIGLFADALVKSGAEEKALAAIEDLEHERRDNEVSFFDDFNSKLVAWRENRSLSSESRRG